MNCTKCQTKNEENAGFCSNCGTNLKSAVTISMSDVLILIFLVILFVTEIIRFGLQHFVDNWYEGGTKFLIIALNLIAGFSTILLGIAIKNMTGKVIGIILATFYLLYIIYSNIDWMLN